MFPLLSKLADLTSASYCTTASGQLTTCSTTTSTAGLAIFSGFFLVIWLALVLVIVGSMWKLFTKAKKPGWAAIIPIYNTLVELQIIGRPWWWLLLMLIPLVNIVVLFIVIFDLAKAYGKSVGYGLLMIFLPIVGYPLLAFGDAQYIGPVASGTAPPQPTPSSQQPAAPQPPVAPQPPTTPPAATPPTNPVQ